MSIASTTISSWEQLLEKARQNTPARRVKRPGQAPSTAPIPSSLHKLPPERKPPVLLYRDSNSWCPFCERVWFALEEKQIPFETEFIDLSNKPKWYTDLVPTTLVPAAKIEGKLVYESKDILLELEEHFGETLLPENPEENAIARQWVEDAETNGFRDIAYKFLRQPPEDAKELANLQAEFEAKLDEIEKTLGRYPKPYFLSTFSLVDIMYSANNSNIVRTREAAAMVATARWMYSSALERKETRGMHKHLDYPQQDANQQHHLISGGLDQVWVKTAPIQNTKTKELVNV